jgi:hypothetical protein
MILPVVNSLGSFYGMENIRQEVDKLNTQGWQNWRASHLLRAHSVQLGENNLSQLLSLSCHAECK